MKSTETPTYTASISILGGGGYSVGGDTADEATNRALAYVGHLHNTGETRALTLVVTRSCATCDGTGRVRGARPFATRLCPACRGKDDGRELERRAVGYGNAFPCGCMACRPRPVAALATDAR